NLMRRTRPTGGETWRAPSLLRGDAVFYKTVLDQLTQPREDRAAPADHLTIDLSATLLDPPEDDSRVSVDPAMHRPDGALRNAVHFHFRRRGAPLTSPFTDLPGPPAAGAEVSQTPEQRQRTHDLIEWMASRLALAARSTSSFPGAFEPASIRTNPPAYAGELPQTLKQGDVPPMPSMRDVFSQVRDDEVPFDVVDGGIFDNIPIGLALQAIQDAPAWGPTSRRLIYLDPSPPTTGSLPRDRPSTAAGFLPTVLAASGLKQRQESSEDEIGLVRVHNETEMAARGRRDVLAQLLHDLSIDSSAVTGLAARYLGYRSSVDAARWARLLIAPSDALLRASVPVKRYPSMSDTDALQVTRRINATYYMPALGLREWLPADAHAVRDAATLLIAWVQAMEKLDPEGADPLGPVKLALYRIRQVARQIEDLSDVEFLDLFVLQSGWRWSALGAAIRGAFSAQAQWCRPEPGGTFDRLLTPKLKEHDQLPTAEEIADTEFWSALDDYFSGPCTTIPDMQEACASGSTGGRLRQALTTLRARRHRANTSATLLCLLWSKLDEALVLVRGVSKDVDPRRRPAPQDQDTLRRRNVWLESIFHEVAHPRWARLSCQQVNQVFAAAGGAPGTADVIEVDRITGNQLSPLEPLLGSVTDAARRQRITWLLRAGAASGPVFERQVAALAGDQLLDAMSKLAGNSLGNFAGFLDPGWRLRDWRWGRLDAAAALVDILLPDDLKPANADSLWRRYVAKPPDGVTAEEWARVLRGDPASVQRPGVTRLTRFQREMLHRGIQAHLQFCVLDEAGERSTEKPPYLAADDEVPAQDWIDRPRSGVSDLAPGYRFGLASRISHLIYRGVWPSTWSWVDLSLRLLLL
ncbi:MAG TPA: DUF3376 domain-containing protein, partial [Kineosporiaceae bacterium]|nr:DUF3376 domain-containing protein [Kineosporiaceae bacterium]